jgi:hypothetical protein
MAGVTAALLLVTVAGAGSVPPLAMLLALIWIAVVSVTLVRRGGVAESAPVAVAPSAGLA